MAYRPPRLHVLLFYLLCGGVWPISGFAQTSPDTQLLYELLNRLERLEQELRQLRGELEVYKYRQGGGSDSYADLERRLQTLEARLGASPGAALSEPALSIEPALPGAAAASPPYPPQTETPSLPDAPEQPVASQPVIGTGETASASATAEEQAAYDAAINDLRAGQYQRAIAGLQSFLVDFPFSPLLSDAQYWLGEAYYVNRDFEQAREIFLSLGAQHPNSDKIPNTLLKLGYIYESLGDNGKARQVYQRLVETYPNNRNTELAEQRLRAIR